MSAARTGSLHSGRHTERRFPIYGAVTSGYHFVLPALGYVRAMKLGSLLALGSRMRDGGCSVREGRETARRQALMG
jgi:hypothetical protein